MNWARERRLQRLVERATWPERREERRRLVLRFRAAMGRWVRDALRQLGVDAPSATSLHWAYEAVAELDALGEPTWALPESFDWLDTDTTRRVEYYRRNTAETPDFSNESLPVVFAWCIARLDPDGTRLTARRPAPPAHWRE